MPSESVRLLELEPDLARFLSPEHRAEAERLLVPLRRLERGPLELATLFPESAAFGAIITHGMVLQRMQVGAHLTMKLLGPGDLLARVSGAASMLVGAWGFSAAEDTTLAMLGHEFLTAVRLYPALAAGLNARMGEQAERFAVQLAICQLPRVEERLLALMWWLAEAWGRVTSVGTVLPLAMTHDVLGALIGARRPTVTLALGELSERGAIVRQDTGWLLLEPPPLPALTAAAIDDPAMISAPPSAWRAGDAPDDNALAASHAELLESVSRLRRDHAGAARDVRRRLEELRAAREALAERRRVLAVTRPPAPS